MELFDILGARPKAATETAFFQWFHLEPVPAESGGRTMRFRPSGPSFKNEVALDITVDGEGNVAQFALCVQRGFIADARNGPFAADITASFVAGVISANDRPAAEPLIAALRREMVNRPTVIARAGAVPEEQPLGAWSGAMDVYYGSADSFEPELSRCELSFQNEVTPTGHELRIVARAC